MKEKYEKYEWMLDEYDLDVLLGEDMDTAVSYRQMVLKIEWSQSIHKIIIKTDCNSVSNNQFAV